MKIISKLQNINFAGLIIISLVSVIAAQKIQVEIAEKPVPFLSLETGQENPKIEVSAVATIDDAGNFLLAVDDENAQLMVVDAKTGRIKKLLPLKGVSNSPKPKWEALARDEEGAYYLAGSHSVKESETDANKLKLRSRLFHFRLQMNGADESTIAIDEASIREWDITDALKADGYSSVIKDNKAKVEGLAVRTLFDADKKILKRELVVGLRMPDNPVRILAGDITRLPETKAKLTLQRLFVFNPGMSGGVNFLLSSIEYVPVWKGFLILTSSEDKDNKFHGNVLWFLPDEKLRTAPTIFEAKLAEPQKVWLFGVDSKAEGICVLPATTGTAKTLQAVLVYDNDGETTKKSSMLQKITLANWAK